MHSNLAPGVSGAFSVFCYSRKSNNKPKKKPQEGSSKKEEVAPKQADSQKVCVQSAPGMYHPTRDLETSLKPILKPMCSDLHKHSVAATCAPCCYIHERFC